MYKRLPLRYALSNFKKTTSIVSAEGNTECDASMP
jgi:hypothetical protein